jgi:hypothetical protein
MVTFIGAEFGEDMQIKCQIKLSNDSVILVDPETLNFIANPDIASIPQTSKDYCQECKKTYSFTTKSLTTSGGDDESSLPFSSKAFSKAHHYARKRRNSKTSCSVERLLSNLNYVECLFGQAQKCPWQSTI